MLYGSVYGLLLARKKKLDVIEAHFDESGIHDGAVVCIVAGYYGHQMPLRRFEKQWNGIIHGYSELTGIGFHAKQFFARNPQGEMVGPYKGWSKDKADKFLLRLVECVVRNGIFPIGFGIIVKDFLALPEIDRKWLTGAKFNLAGKAVTSGCPNKPYYLPFQYCVLHTANMLKGTQTEQVQYYAGLDRTLSGYATVLYKHLLRDVRLPASLIALLGGINYPFAKDTPALQAADLLANQLYQQSLLIVSGKVTDPPWLLKKLAKNARPDQTFLLFDAKYLRRIQEYGREAYAKLLRTGTVSSYLERLRKM